MIGSVTHCTYELDDVRRLFGGKSSVGGALPPVLGPGEDVLQRGEGQRPAHGRHAGLAQSGPRLQFQVNITNEMMSPQV